MLTVVVTVTGWAPAVLMTWLPPFSCASVPLACSIAGHPLTAVRTVPDECPPRAAAALTAITVRRPGPASTRGRVRRGSAGGAACGVSATRPRTPSAMRFQRFASAR
jgi:hypothetical protein